jgi:hypothetical protein
MTANRLLALLVAVVVVGAAASTASASATRLATAAGGAAPGQFQGWVDRAHVPTPPGLVTLVLEACPASATAAGCAYAEARLVHLAPLGRDQRTFFHELGHVYDAHVLTAADRLRFRRLIGVRSGPWLRPGGGDSAGEQFAEAYATCARFRTLRRTHFGMYDYVASPARHAAVCGLIRTAAAR